MHTTDEDSYRSEGHALQLTSSVQAPLQQGQMISASRQLSAQLALTQDMDVITSHTDSSTCSLQSGELV